MADVTRKEARQPCLLDRLADDEPSVKQESRDKRVMSMSQIRKSVLRDLEWLLNTSARSDQVELKDYPHVASSVLNYGIQDLTGLTSSGVSPVDLERMLQTVIKRFEPRILPNSLSVGANADPDEVGTNAVCFEIRGMLWSQPLPERLYVKTEVDLETGLCKVQDNPNG
jgi:type VI secretion system protein ImpF